jgi:hypothetical protein
MCKTGQQAARLFMAVIFILSLVAGISPAHAQDPLCDAGLYDQMSQRARLQGQRETVTAQNLIYKPDSVMEYTCFSRFVSHIPPNIHYTSSYLLGGSETSLPTFTVTRDFPPQPMLDISRIPGENWIFGNFGHTFLGGRLTTPPAVTAAAANYVCDAMAVVWNLAKCQNAAPQEPQDGFYGLLAFSSAAELRRYPALCNAAYTVNTGALPATAAIIYTSALVAAADCGQAVPTGSTVNMPLDANEPAGRPIVYNERVCANPACTYVPTGLNTGNCVP